MRRRCRAISILPSRRGRKIEMLKELSVAQVRLIGLLVNAARARRDSILGNVTEAHLDGLNPGRGEHNPTAELGFEPLPAQASQTAALREAVASLSPLARQELYALMRIGQGDLGAKQWRRGLSEAEALGDETVLAAIMENADLHDQLTKGLYEIKLS
jgi:Protein of unknown function (DUF3775)